MGQFGKVTKAVIPAAGLGTRFLPATKATPKEMLPVVDKPAIQYVVEEAVAANIHDILLITSRNKGSLEDHFDRGPELEQRLADRGETQKLATVSDLVDLANFHYVRQHEPKGLGHAVLTARSHVGDAPFIVMLGDDLIDEATPVLGEMLNVQEEFGGSVLLLMEVPDDSIHLYGCAAVEPTHNPHVMRVTGLIEKPEPGTAPSNYAVIGRYVLSPEVFNVLQGQQPGRGGEIQLTDALATLVDRPVEHGGGVHAVIFKGKRYDTGDKLSYIKSVLELALQRDDLGPALKSWLRTLPLGDS